MLNLRTIILLFITLVLLSGIAFAEIIELDGRYWISDLRGTVRVTEGTASGTDINFKNDLGIADEDFSDFRVLWRISPNCKVRLGFMEIGYNSDKNITEQINYKGQIYTIGTRVSSELDAQYLRLGWIWQFLNIADETIKFGPIIEFKGVNLKASLDAPSLSISESEDFLGVLPTVGAALDVNLLNIINIFSEASGIVASDYGYLFDAEVGFKMTPLKYFTIKAGYRIVDFKFEDGSDYAKLKMSGPFFGGSFKF